MHIDFKNNQIKFLDMVPQNMMTNEAGQIVIDLMHFPSSMPSSKSSTSQPAVITQCSLADESPKDGVRKKIALKQKEFRCLLAQLNKNENAKQSKILVAELFSPPRFSKVAESIGEKGLAFDKKLGCDLLDPATQKKVSQQLDEARPKLL